ncbi:MAG: hypothetical protein K6T75_03270 [Acetobacteraceae bacterium]|nr:hypothetical protein [Acetobacteraceae bacterium]
MRVYNQRHGNTVILTSHYLEDIRQLAPRVIIINLGTVVYDGPLEALVSRAGFQHVTVRHEAGPGAAGPAPAPAQPWERYGRVVTRSPQNVVIRVEREKARSVAAALVGAPGVLEVALSEPPLEDVIADIYAGTPGLPEAAEDGGARTGASPP